MQKYIGIEALDRLREAAFRSAVDRRNTIDERNDTILIINKTDAENPYSRKLNEEQMLNVTIGNSYGETEIPPPFKANRVPINQSPETRIDVSPLKQSKQRIIKKVIELDYDQQHAKSEDTIKPNDTDISVKREEKKPTEIFGGPFEKQAEPNTDDEMKELERKATIDHPPDEDAPTLKIANNKQSRGLTKKLIRPKASPAEIEIIKEYPETDIAKDNPIPLKKRKLNPEENKYEDVKYITPSDGVESKKKIKRKLIEYDDNGNAAATKIIEDPEKDLPNNQYDDNSVKRSKKPKKGSVLLKKLRNKKQRAKEAPIKTKQNLSLDEISQFIAENNKQPIVFNADLFPDPIDQGTSIITVQVS